MEREIMGYTMTDKCCENLNTLQTPATIVAVRVRAGWTAIEVARELHVPARVIERAEAGFELLPQDLWVSFLSLCGRRAFDDEL